MQKKGFFILGLMYFLLPLYAIENDTTGQKTNIEIGEKKSPSTRKFSPKVAATLSAIIPGAGQIYNQKYWKLPIVYGALGYFAYDIYASYKLYTDLSFALVALNKLKQNDSTDFKKVDPIIQRLNVTSVENYKNRFRRQVDESSLWFLVFWGLNIVDAAVDAHLKSFDVSDNLTLKIHPNVNAIAATGQLNYNLKLDFEIKSKNKKSKFLAYKY